MFSSVKNTVVGFLKPNASVPSHPAIAQAKEALRDFNTYIASVQATGLEPDANTLKIHSPFITKAINDLASVKNTDKLLNQLFAAKDTIEASMTEAPNTDAASKRSSTASLHG